MRIAAFVVLAALSGWFVRGIQFEDDAPPPVAAPRAQIDEGPRSSSPEIATIQHVPLDAHSSHGNRNLFAYRVHERPAYVAPPVVETSGPIVITATVEPLPVAPPPIPFPYRYIGRFGPPQNVVAAFTREGEVLTVRAGDRIGAFVLRTIGLESVEIEGTDGLRRVPLS